MDVRTAGVAAENQRNAAHWSERSRTWRDRSEHKSHIGRAFCLSFATVDQETAARIYRADRVLRGMEG